ncbi:hypothetical protein MmTuc01_0920 [Methanosarcina mazei Tuc01]|uniref:Uncharacterized protein n=1 Tax=Methanosarcina mazei Tuc01 TaxID=1236903 RepID=M1Q232_METMZ|nr:hypothetical protein MmTuc01_0920 [Methanosarcina mazei Tuc01]
MLVCSFYFYFLFIFVLFLSLNFLDALSDIIIIRNYNY